MMARIVQTGAMVVVDYVDQVQWYGNAARNSDRRIDVLVDLDVGDDRTSAGNLYDRLYACCGEHIEAIWPVNGS